MLVIDPAQQFGELCAKFDCFLDLQPITNRLQYGSKKTVRAVFIVPPKSCVEIIDPGMCKLNGMFRCFRDPLRS